MLRTDLKLPESAIAQICRDHDVVELAIFGSALRGDFTDESDVDFLVVFRDNDAGPWMSKFTDLEEALSKVLGRKADVVDKRAVERSENYIRRKHILDTAQTIIAR